MFLLSLSSLPHFQAEYLIYRKWPIVNPFAAAGMFWQSNKEKKPSDFSGFDLQKFMSGGTTEFCGSFCLPFVCDEFGMT